MSTDDEPVPERSQVDDGPVPERSQVDDGPVPERGRVDDGPVPERGQVDDGPVLLDQSLLDPTRFSIAALLAAAKWAEFGFVRDSLALSDSALSKQITTLGKLNYVDVEKGYVGKRPRTWVRLNDTGRGALHRHVAALEQISRHATEIGGSHPPRP